jgi:hypothetical protein
MQLAGNSDAAGFITGQGQSMIASSSAGVVSILKTDVNRREFLKITAGAGAALAMPTSGHSAVSPKMIGIQVGAV